MSNRPILHLRLIDFHPSSSKAGGELKAGDRKLVCRANHPGTRYTVCLSTKMRSPSKIAIII